MTARHHTLAVMEAIRQAERDGIVSSNRVRPLIPEWVPSRAVGQVYSQLRRQGVLEHDGYEPSTDEKGRNAGKLVPLYRLRKPLTAVDATPPTQTRAEAATSPRTALSASYGPCCLCRGWTVRYGPLGRPICQACEATR